MAGRLERAGATGQAVLEAGQDVLAITRPGRTHPVPIFPLCRQSGGE